MCHSLPIHKELSVRWNLIPCYNPGFSPWWETGGAEWVPGECLGGEEQTERATQQDEQGAQRNKRLYPGELIASIHYSWGIY